VNSPRTKLILTFVFGSHLTSATPAAQGTFGCAVLVIASESKTPDGAASGRGISMARVIDCPAMAKMRTAKLNQAQALPKVVRLRDEGFRSFNC
jgi:hypothetical protein